MDKIFDALETLYGGSGIHFFLTDEYGNGGCIFFRADDK